MRPQFEHEPFPLVLNYFIRDNIKGTEFGCLIYGQYAGGFSKLVLSYYLRRSQSFDCVGNLVKPSCTNLRIIYKSFKRIRKFYSEVLGGKCHFGDSDIEEGIISELNVQK
jgi:hypothetical protein